jgi:small GTP-binding protein
MQTQGPIKIVIAGLSYAGKTSIMRAIERKFGYIDEVLRLKPTTKINYVRTTFLEREVVFWDMGGQEKYRKMYKRRREFYFAATDILIYIIDTQDEDSFEESLGYLSSVLEYFKEGGERVPLIVAFHKSDPDIAGDPAVAERVRDLTSKISEAHPFFDTLFQQTSIYDIISITQLISYALSAINREFLQLYRALEAYSERLDVPGLLILDENGLIVSEFFREGVDPKVYEGLIDSIKEHIFELKRLKDRGRALQYKIFPADGGVDSCLHSIEYGGKDFYMSVLLTPPVSGGEARETDLEGGSGSRPLR